MLKKQHRKISKKNKKTIYNTKKTDIGLHVLLIILFFLNNLLCLSLFFTGF